MIKLLDFSKGSGCGCKLPPAALNEVLHSFRQAPHKNLLSGNIHNEDAAVWELNAGQVLISTVDFFTPVVNDAFSFGVIASANAISDVYAMGGTPAFALAILGWPASKIPVSESSRVMKGALKTCQEAGVMIAGGHTIDSEEPIFGLAVNGFCDKKRLKSNSGAKAGDFLYLTKPIGTGILAAAYRRGLISDTGEKLMIETMSQLNIAGEALSSLNSVHALTDVTGFGLLGHLHEMASGSGCSIVLNKDTVPVFEESRELAAKFVYPNITTSNYQAVQEFCPGLDGIEFLWLCDPQTNGGLLVAVDPYAEDEFLKTLQAFETDVIKPVRIGYFESTGHPGFIKLV